MKLVYSTIALVLALATSACAQPATVGTLNLTATNPAVGSFTGHAASTVSWWEIIHPGNFLEVDVCGSTFDTELGLYDASGVRLRVNDDFCGLQSSVDGGSLTAGTYYAAVSGFNTVFHPTQFDVIGGTSTGDINITATATELLPPSTLAMFDLTTTTSDTHVANADAGSIHWYEIIHGGGDLTVSTVDALTTLPDTEVGLYDIHGDLLRSNDDVVGFLSRLTLNLAPGTYYAAAGGFDVVFGEPFDVTSSDNDLGDIKLIASATPSTLDTFNLTATTLDLHVANADAGTINWYEIIHPGGGLMLSTDDPLTTLPNTEVGLYDVGGFFVDSNDDVPGSLLSELTVTLAAGTYYVAVGGYNAAFGESFDVTSDDSNLGDIKLIASLVAAGDFNGDGTWNCTDIDALVVAIASGSIDLSFDMNGDDVINSADITDAGVGWLAVGGANNPAATGGNAFLVADANLDGTVDGADFLIWNNNKFTTVAAWCSADFTADGIVDDDDFLVWNNNKFRSSNQDASLVPEPAAFGMLLFALLLGGLMRGRSQLL